MKLKCFIVISSLFLVVGCANKDMTRAVGTYELTGQSLKVALGVVKPACEAGTLKAEDCTRYKKIYADAKGIYVMAGGTLIAAVETSDAVQRQAFLTEYSSLVSQYMALSNQYIQFAVEKGLLKGGAK